MRLTITKLNCRRCGHRWVPTQAVIRICPRCKSKRWETKRTNRQGLRGTV